MYVGLVKYDIDNPSIVGIYLIGHQPTNSIDLILRWKRSTEQLPHVIDCQIYELKT